MTERRDENDTSVIRIKCRPWKRQPPQRTQDERLCGGSESSFAYFSSGFCLPSSKYSTSVFLPLLL